MHLEDRFATAHIWTIEHNAPVKTAGAQQGRVKDIRAVGGGHDDDVGIGIKAIHFNQHLVQGLLALIMAAAQAGAALAADRINFIDKHDAGGMALGLVKQVAHAAGADADKHFNEFGTGNREERHPGFTGNRFRDQGFTGSWRANQQHTLGNARAELDELLRFAQEFDHFFQLLLGFIDARDIIKGDGWMIAGEHARPGFAEGHGRIVAALRLPENKEKDSTQNQEGQDITQGG